MSRALSWLLVLVLFGGFLTLGGYLLRQRALAGQGMPGGSIFDESDDGLGELAQVMRRAGWKTVALTRPVTQTRRRGLLLLVEPGATRIDEAAGLRLLNWVGAGNTLLLATAKSTGVHQHLGIRLTTDDRADPDSFSRVDQAPGAPYWNDIDELSVNRMSMLSVPPKAIVLWRVGGRVGAVQMKHGKGKVIILGDPTLLTRRGLVRGDGEPRDDNVLFPLNVADREARGGVVLFDEHAHGFRAATGFWAYLGYHSRRWALLPVAFVLGLALWRFALRLGPARPIPEGERTDAVAYAGGVARIYQQAGTRKLMARVLVRDFLQSLTKYLGLKRVALPAIILGAWRQQHPKKPIEPLQGLLRGVGELRKGEVDDRTLLGWTKAFDRFRHEQLT